MKKLLSVVLLTVFFGAQSTDLLSTMNLQDNSIKTHGAEKLFNKRDNEGNTPAHILGLQCREEFYNNPENIAKMIVALDKGAFNPFMENNNNRTPRDEASIRGCQMMADMLFEYEEAYRLYYQDQIKGK